MSNLTGISVIIPNYNGVNLLPQILPTVFTALRKTNLPAEIIVVDDCSADASVQMLAEKFPQVKILQNKINSGFSITANKGINAANYDWVLLLNSDVKLEEDYFIPLLKYTDRKNVFGVMGRITGWQDDNIQDGAKYPFFHGIKIKTSGNYLLNKKDEMANGIYSQYLSGANAFINKKIFTAIGGFNELFSPFYVEDFELSLRAWRLGYSCWFDYHAVCRHKTSTTIAGKNKKQAIRKIYNRNKMYLHAIHLSSGKRKLWFLQLIIESLIHLITLKFYYLNSLFQFIKNYNYAIESRQKIQEMAGDKKLLTLNEVADNIISTLKGKEITRF